MSEEYHNRRPWARVRYCDEDCEVCEDPTCPSHPDFFSLEDGLEEREA